MSDETENLPSWRKKFLATRMAMESILFERELLQPHKEKLSTGLLGLAGIWLFFTALLAQWALRRGYFFAQADADSLKAVLNFAAYVKVQGFWALVKPDFSVLSFNPPLYYLAYVPVLDFVTRDLNLAVVIVNSFFMLVLALAVYLAVTESRPQPAGWLGAAFALALPFVLETARRPDPAIALMALTAAVYACYIRSSEFAVPKWTLAFSVCLALGFYAHGAFWLYALPTVPFIGAGLANPNSRDDLFKGLFVGLVINLPWYLFAASAVAAGLVPLWGKYHGFWHYFGLGASAAGLPMFAVGAAALAWLYFSVFMAYPHKKTIAAWFWLPYLLLTWGLRGSHATLLYPALLSFAVAVAVMTPHQARKFLMAFVLVLGAVNQSGLLRPVTSGRYTLAGLPVSPASVYRASDLVRQVVASAPAGGGLAAVYGDSALNADSLRFACSKAAPLLKFDDAPACPACATLLIRRTPRPGETPGAAESAFGALAASGWFQSLFVKKDSLALPDGSGVEVYARLPAGPEPLSEGVHELTGLVLGPLSISDASLTLSGYDAASGAYAKGVLFAPVAELYGGDIYGLTLDVGGLSLAGPELSNPALSGVGSVKVRSAKITAYALENFLSSRYPFLKNPQVKLDDGAVELFAKSRGRNLDVSFGLSLKNGAVLEARPLFFSFDNFQFPTFLLKLFTFSKDFSGNPYGITASGLRVRNQMIEIY